MVSEWDGLFCCDWGRLYPLHFAMLAVGVAFKLVADLIPGASSINTGSTGTIHTPNEAPGTILANLLLIQSLHVYDFFYVECAKLGSAPSSTLIIFLRCMPSALRSMRGIALLSP